MFKFFKRKAVHVPATLKVALRTFKKIDLHDGGVVYSVNLITTATAIIEDKSILCLVCHRRSFNTEDARNRFCGACLKFHSHVLVSEKGLPNLKRRSHAPY